MEITYQAPTILIFLKGSPGKKLGATLGFRKSLRRKKAPKSHMFTYTLGRCERKLRAYTALNNLLHSFFFSLAQIRMQANEI